jgi:hypothetical protein
MHGSSPAAWLLVLLCAATGLSCFMNSARSEGLLGAGMAVMAVPGSVLGTRPWGPPLLEALFAAVALRTLSHCLRLGRGRPARRSVHHAHHALCAAAMVYMAAAMVPAGGHTTHDPGGVPLLTGLLLAYFAAYVLAAGVRLASIPALAAPAAAPGGGVRVREPIRYDPGLTAACRVATATGMIAMLLAV